ncbi:MAG: GNAT family N-acetyltransferase [Methanomicrobiales archaeon]
MNSSFPAAPHPRTHRIRIPPPQRSLVSLSPTGGGSRRRPHIRHLYRRDSCRCCPGTRLYPDGHEVDGVFTLEEFRGRGLARLVVQTLIDACGHEELYMHSTLQLISFYKTFGFVPIPEDQLPKMIRERFLFCFGEMAGCNICPMRREAGG